MLKWINMRRIDGVNWNNTYSMTKSTLPNDTDYEYGHNKTDFLFAR